MSVKKEDMIFNKYQLRKVEVPYKNGSMMIFVYKLRLLMRLMNYKNNFYASSTKFEKFIKRIYDLIVSIFALIHISKTPSTKIDMMRLVLIKLRQESIAHE